MLIRLLTEIYEAVPGFLVRLFIGLTMIEKATSHWEFSMLFVFTYPHHLHFISWD